MKRKRNRQNSVPLIQHGKDPIRDHIRNGINLLVSRIPRRISTDKRSTSTIWIKDQSNFVRPVETFGIVVDIGIQKLPGVFMVFTSTAQSDA